MKKEPVEYYAPYKEYLFGLIKRPDGWRDLGRSGLFTEGKFKPYAVTIAGEHYSGEEAIRYNSVCRDCWAILNIGQWLEDNKTFHHCPKCRRMYSI